MKLLHVLSAFWFISGVVGRDLTFWWAGRATDVRAVDGLLQISEFFERRGVIPGGSIVLLFGLLAAWLRDWPILGFLQGATSNWLLVSLILYLAGTLVIIPLRLRQRSRQRHEALESALEQGAITPELTAALHERVVNRFRVAELVLLALIIILMVTKPF